MNYNCVDGQNSVDIAPPRPDVSICRLNFYLFQKQTLF